MSRSLRHFHLFLIFSVTMLIEMSCSSSLQIELRVKLSKLIIFSYDEIEIWVGDGSGKIVRFERMPRSLVHEINIGEVPEKIQIFVWGSRSGSRVMEGASPVFITSERNELEILFLPNPKSVVFSPVRTVISPDIWVYPVEMSDAMYIFTETGDVFMIDYFLWEIRRIGNFTARSRFSVLKADQNGRDVMFILGGEDGDGPSDLIEVFIPPEGEVRRAGRLKHRRVEAVPVLWDKDIIIFGGERDGYCESFSIGFTSFVEGSETFRCDVTGDFSLFPVQQSEGLMKLFVYHRERGEHEVLYLMRNRNSFEVSYRFKPESIKRMRGEIARQGDKVMIIGGYNERGEISECEIYDPLSDSVSVSGRMNPRIGFSAVSIDGNVFVVGGRRMDGTPVVDVEVGRDCVFENTGKRLSFPPKPENCAISLFGSYIALICQGVVPEIFPVISDLTGYR